MPILQQISEISGWEPWYYAKTIRNDAGNVYNTASAPFPPSYLPARAFIAETFAVHCAIPAPWAFFEDPFSVFLLGGGASGTLLGALSGLYIAGQFIRNPGHGDWGDWGIGREQIGIPDVGFCFGEKYKEHAYFYYNVVNLGLAQVSGRACLDVFQRSKLKRLFVIEGMVVSFVSYATPILSDPLEEPDPQYKITLDFEGVVPDGLPSVIDDTINIYKEDGVVTTLTIKELLPNWELVVTFDSDEIPASEYPDSGDFYRLNTPWTVDDPYMMSGFWEDPDDYAGYKLYSTTHQLPYEEVKFVGNYVYKEKEGDVSPVAVGSAFGETETHEWAWEYYTGTESNIYGLDPDRYFWIEGGSEEEPGFEGDYISPSMKKFVTTSGDLAAWKELEGITYARMEIDKGGDGQKHNWQAPILTRCWFEQGGNSFAILGQPDGNVIDVSLRDVTDTVDLNTDVGAEGSILNQYAWMINEHFTDCGSGKYGVLGFLQGEVDSAEYDETTNETDITFTSSWNSVGTIVENWPEATEGPDPNSFYNRFISTFTEGSLKNMWVKFDGWRVYDQTYKKTGIVIPDSVVITPSVEDLADMDSNSKTSIHLRVNGDLSSATTAGFYFDTPYERIGQNLLPVLIYTFSQGQQEGNVSPFICVDMSYRTATMEVLLPAGTRVGSCGATMWGLGLRGQSSVYSDNNLDLFVTVPLGPRIISSFYHYNRQQDWIFFQDIDTDRVTLRTGNLDYTETPRRAEVILGLPEYIGEASSFPITFDTEQERVKFLSMSLPDETDSGSLTDDFNPSALTFQIDNPNDYFGFKSTGGGIFGFQALRENGYPDGTVDYSEYKNQGSFLSPVYLYKHRESDITKHRKDTLELGIPTSKKLYVKNGSPSDINVVYVKDKQTLKYVNVFDAHQVNDGEIMVVYGNFTDKFTIDGDEYDPIEDDWPSTESIFITGSSDNALSWGTPLAKRLKLEGDEDYQYPIMILNACKYIASYFHSITNRLVILAKCYFEDTTEDELLEYLGCFTVNRLTLPDEIEIAEPEDEDDVLKFWVRPSRILNTVADDVDKTYTTPDAVLTTGVDVEGSAGNVLDSFIRIIGPEETNCKITADISDMGYISIIKLTQGTTIILYKADDGVRMLSSHDLVRWDRSEIILAKDGHSPLLFGDNLFYITPEGIEIKVNIQEYMHWASLVTEEAGYDDEDIERVQEKFDDARTTLIGSGKIDPQRISAHVSHDGTTKVMYYNSENILNCLESGNTVEWHVAHNF